ncbi:hypothetical protein MNBD_GAMMA24-1361 [hydrothermal vent metagenome]|uniref:Lipoprotein LPP20-like domain-containing protein n=1 Tax=hydrothermal vent metagenome TaxID=652676 RepID=A0A3B1B9X5_9ZZZZ
MRNLLFPFLILSFLINAGCASKGPVQPDWVNGNSSKYPPAKYISGKGQAKYQALARDRARADLAKVFEVRIQEQSKDSSQSSRQTQDGKTRLSLSSNASRDIRSQTDQIISGIEIADTWQDKTSKQFYVLAVLNRTKAGNILRDNINRLDDITANAIRRARQINNLLRKIALAHRALQAQLERQIYQQQLKIVEYSGRGLKSPYDLATLASDRETLLQRLTIRTKISADPLGGLAGIVKGAVSAAGFTNLADAKAQYILDAKLRLNESQGTQGWYWQRGTLEISLRQAASQQVQGSKRWNIKVSAQDQAMTKKRARDQIDKILKQELRQTIISFGSTESP